MRSDNEKNLNHAAEDETRVQLSLSTWEGLPLLIRVQHRLVDILVLVDELKVDLQHRSVADLGWMGDDLDVIYDTVDRLLDALTN